jgi:hypothetical protein
VKYKPRAMAVWPFESLGHATIRTTSGERL